MKFTSWIPTITGKLSFNRFGKAQFSGKTEVSFNETGLERNIFCANERFLSDVNIPFLKSLIPSSVFQHFAMRIRNHISKFYFDQNSHFVFIFSGKNDSRTKDSINGIVSIFLVDDIDAQWPYVLELSSVFKNRLKEFDTKLSDDKSPLLNELIAHIPVNINKNGSFLCECDDVNFADEYILKLNSNDLKDIKENIALQVYTFVRDICHTHYHHSPYSDAIVDIFEYEEGKTSFDWRQRAFNNIMRKIMIRRSSISREDNVDALGMIQYANSFKSIFFRDSIGVEKSFPEFARPHNDGHADMIQFSLLEKSVKARISNATSYSGKTGRALSIANSIFMVVFALMSVAIAAAGLLQVGGDSVAGFIKDSSNNPLEVSSVWRDVILWIYKNPTTIIWSFLFFCVSVISTSILSVGLSRQNKDLSSGLVRDSTRFAISFGGKNIVKSAFFLAFLSLFPFALSFLLIIMSIFWSPFSIFYLFFVLVVAMLAYWICVTAS
jgi:hypothetical protein